jgi:hypothetical protein
MKSKHYIFLQAMLIVLFLSVQAHAQNTQIIRGTVKTVEDNRPLPGANIYLKSLSSVGTFSDAKGEFEFPRPLKSGDALVFSFLGLKTTEYIVPEGPVVSLVIEMEADIIQMVDEILVEEKEAVVISQKRIRKQKGHQ